MIRVTYNFPEKTQSLTLIGVSLHKIMFTYLLEYEYVTNLIYNSFIPIDFEATRRRLVSLR